MKKYLLVLATLSTVSLMVLAGYAIFDHLSPDTGGNNLAGVRKYNDTYRQMQILTVNGQWDKLEQLTRSELKKEPNELYARWFLIKALIGKKKWSEAEEVLDGIEAEQPSWKKKIDEIRGHVDIQREKETEQSGGE